MSEFKWLPSKGSRTYEALAQYYPLVGKGVILSIDPSIGSNSSMPGWAIYRAGEYVESGTLEIDPTGDIPTRLQTLARYVRQLISMWQPDIVVYEEIPPKRYGGGNATAHASLLKALGVILSVPGPTGYVGLWPSSWKKLVRPEYRKGDEEDAVEMGWIALQLAEVIGGKVEASKQKRKGRKKKLASASSNDAT